MGSKLEVSPFAPAKLPTMPEIPGVKLATAEAGIKYQGRRDLLLAVFEPGTIAAGVLTRSKTRSAAVDWCAQQLQHGRARALVVNSGNANAFTGKRGVEAVRLTAQAAARAVGCEPEEVFIASTGVIGEPLESEKFAHLLDGLAKTASPDGWHDAARAIMTTDTYPKLATSPVAEINEGAAGTSTVISGIAKGAGMIAPDMATMLSFLVTDAAIDRDLLQRSLTDAATVTFNCITVDGDTSTSDTVLVFATGKSGERGVPKITSAAPSRVKAFNDALGSVTHDLAQAIVRDGEGITKHVTIALTGAQNDKAARNIAMSIANSPLVKTAFAGEDPNWGRIVMAVGKSGELADRDKLDIWFGPHQMATSGERAPDHDEDKAAAYMKNSELEVRVDVGIGSGTATVWTCDLTHGYITINADYRS
ncbi:MAG: bifunctional glutamate N-acetyltransferase/amino-acid acetyltransferase ArgJ [Alphaproteobacteria bacterium]|nr:bifunctional glutamate N-acetyltransferase/amino-acid acetyltransferase ArgJ [Alphaproteobacteria bacterium]